ncbi:MAG: aspartate kinase [Myxococcaceae bacterium]|nr:aspartate kinase [Myxococcaceae bacterium]
MARIVVQKFGGSSVSSVEKIRKVAERVKARRDEGWQLVVVVSAMGDTTDELLALAKQISPDPPRRELDMLLTCGERISMALMSMALHELGVPAISFTGSQSGIITDDTHSQARIVEVRPARLEEALGQGKVVIVAGYQGVSRGKEVTTLGRGGSDTSAVALAAALHADCEIYSDVDGVFSADPRVVPSAKKLDAISPEEMQELATAGAKVLNAQAVEFAREHGIVIHAKSTHAAGTGTRIQPTPGEKGRVRGVTCEADVWAFCVQGPPDALLELLDANQVKPRSVSFDASGRTLVLVPLQDVHGPEALRQKLPAGVTVLDDLGTVTCVGTGLHADALVLRKALTVAHALAAPVVAMASSALQLTVVTSRAQAKALTKGLHEALIGQAEASG